MDKRSSAPAAVLAAAVGLSYSVFLGTRLAHLM